MYNHKNHYENIFLYGRCDCGVSENSSFTAGDLAKKLEEKKLAQTYPEFLNKGRVISKEEANIPL